MDEEDYILIENEYYNFKEKLSKDIQNPSISMQNKDCYLIEESWSNEITNYFDKYHNYKNNNKFKNNTDFSDFLPENGPVFINNFSSVIKCLKNNKKLIIVSRELIESIYEEDDLKNYNIVKYYSGNNKLIIKFTKNDDKKALLIINPIYENLIQNINNDFIISIKDEENNTEEIFKELLLKENNLNYEIKLNYNYNIIPFEKYLKLLKLLVNIYYYEKSLLDNKEDIFKENKDYYLINHDWIDKIKNYYKNFFKSLSTIKTNKAKLNYNNLNKFFKSLTYYRNDLNIENNKLFVDIMNIEKIKPKREYNNKILYHPNCYIINSEIKDIIISIFNNKKFDFLKKKEIYIQNENVYLIYTKQIILGNINKELLFIPNYIISYDTSKILKSEYKYLISTSIDKYINSLNCDINNSELQILTDKNNGKIGKFIILLNQMRNKEKNTNQNYKAISANSTPKKKTNTINIFNKPNNIKSRNKIKNIVKQNSDENILYQTTSINSINSKESEKNQILYKTNNSTDNLTNNEIINLNNF